MLVRRHARHSPRASVSFPEPTQSWAALMSGSCFAEGSFTRGLRREPALPSPQSTAAVAAFNAAKLSAYFSRLPIGRLSSIG
jgi:hypothetical protein